MTRSCRVRILPGLRKPSRQASCRGFSPLVFYLLIIVLNAFMTSLRLHSAVSQQALPLVWLQPSVHKYGVLKDPNFSTPTWIDIPIGSINLGFLTKGNTYPYCATITRSSSRKTQRRSRVSGRISGAVAGEYHHQLSSNFTQNFIH